MVNYTLGFSACFVAGILFGLNFFPVKRYDIKDGIFFQWVMCSAIWITGLIVQFIQNSLFVPLAVLCGVIWCIGNIVCFTVIRDIGLGIGLLVWGCTSTISSWLIGYFGFFVTAQPVGNLGLNVAGIFIIFFALLCMSQVKKERDALCELEEGQNEKFTRIRGFGLAIVTGLCFSTNLVPIQALIDSGQGSENYLDYVFSHFSGIYLTSTACFLKYCMWKRETAELPHEIVLPSFLSGMLWALGDICVFLATQELKFVITVPIFTILPALIACLAGVVWFKEIKGTRNIRFLLGSLGLAIVGVTCVAVSVG